MALLQDKLVTVVVETGTPLKPDEVDEAIGGMSNMAFRALVQLLEQYRQEHASAAASCFIAGNQSAAAIDVGGYQTLSELIDDLQSRRKPTD